MSLVGSQRDWQKPGVLSGGVRASMQRYEKSCRKQNGERAALPDWRDQGMGYSQVSCLLGFALVFTTVWIRLELFLKRSELGVHGLGLVALPTCASLENHWIQQRRERQLFVSPVSPGAKRLVCIAACGAKVVTAESVRAGEATWGRRSTAREA
jgi:hypothetical protein